MKNTKNNLQNNIEKEKVKADNKQNFEEVMLLLFLFLTIQIIYIVSCVFYKKKGNSS